MRLRLLEKLRVPVQQNFNRQAELSLFRSIKTAVNSQPVGKQASDEAGNSSPLPEEPNLTAEEVRETLDQATSQASEQNSQGEHGQRNEAFSQSAREGASGSTSSSSSTGKEEQSGSSDESRWKGSEGAQSQDNNSTKKGSSAKPRSFAERLKTAYETVKREVADAVLPRQETMSATKARDPSIRPAGDPTSSGLTIVKQEESKWRKQWGDMQEKLGKHPFFQRLHGLSDNKAFNKGREVADNLRERWETSDSRFVQKIQDFRDNMATESEPAQALREIRSRYPDFDMVHFVRMLKTDVPVVIKAYLEGNLEALKEHSSREMMERFTGIINAQQAEGLVSDSTILYTSDVELVDIKFVEGDPVVVVQFSCQQLNCTRDKFGNVVEGSPTDVQRVYYFWALQQEDAGFVGQDGKFHPPRWQLREMMVRGMHNLL